MAWQSSGWRCALLIGLAATCVRASETVPLRRYKMITETGMPHLEENLRYTVTHETRCLTAEALSSAFPMLAYTSLAGCMLRDERAEADIVSYRLVCEGNHGTTGNATWRRAERVSYGTLNVKLGGKNMTVFQRITATDMGECHHE
jgi:hypothetical protein